MGTLFKSASGMDPRYYEKKRQFERERGRSVSNSEFEEEGYAGYDGNDGTLPDSGTSVFDPALCEVMYAWFTAPGDRVLDPFAGGSVRGIVASIMGRDYTGVELRAEQVEANAAQGLDICGSDAPRWVNGDSARIDELVPEGDFDFILTCPPYADLEVYSNDPADISNMPIDQFLAAYETIMRKTVAKLHDDRFAVVVMGEARGKDGFYYGIVPKTVEIMERAGARYYNEAILVTPVGSLPIRVGKQFEKSRKLGKTHQNVLVFCKGDPRKATERLGKVYVPDEV